MLGGSITPFQGSFRLSQVTQACAPASLCLGYYIAGLSALQLIRLVFHFSSPRPADSETLPRGADASARAAQTPAGGGGTLSRGDESAGKRAESSDRGDGALPQAAGTEPKRGESEPRSGDSEAKRGDTLPRSGESEGKRAVTFWLLAISSG